MENTRKPAILLIDDNRGHQAVFQRRLPKILGTDKYDVLAPMFTTLEETEWGSFNFLDDEMAQETRDLIYRNRSRINLVLTDAQLKGLTLPELLGEPSLRYFKKQETPFILWSLAFDMFWAKAYRSVESKKKLLEEESDINDGLNFVDCMKKSGETSHEEIKATVSRYLVY